MDFWETFAHVEKRSTVRAMYVVIAMIDCLAYQMDVSNEFMHGDFEEIIYMRLSKGYIYREV